MPWPFAPVDAAPAEIDPYSFAASRGGRALSDDEIARLGMWNSGTGLTLFSNLPHYVPPAGYTVFSGTEGIPLSRPILLPLTDPLVVQTYGGDFFHDIPQAIADFQPGLTVIGAGVGLTAGITAILGAGTAVGAGTIAADVPPSIAAQPFEANFPAPEISAQPAPFEANFPQVDAPPFEDNFPPYDGAPQKLPSLPPGTTDILKQAASAANAAKSLLPLLGAAGAAVARASAASARPISSTLTTTNGAPTFGAGLPKRDIWASVKPLLLPAAIVTGLLYLS